MAEPLSTTAGVIGISSFALSNIKELHDFVKGLAEADDEVREIESSLDAIQQPLDTLKELKIQDERSSAAAKEILEKVGVGKAVQNCSNSCVEFRKKLQKWTKHSDRSESGQILKLSIRDKVSISAWNRESVNKFNYQLQRCQGTAHFAVGIVTLYVTLQIFIIYRGRMSVEC